MKAIGMWLGKEIRIVKFRMRFMAYYNWLIPDEFNSDILQDDQIPHPTIPHMGMGMWRVVRTVSSSSGNESLIAPFHASLRNLTAYHR